MKCINIFYNTSWAAVNSFINFAWRGSEDASTLIQHKHVIITVSLTYIINYTNRDSMSA